MVAWDIEVGETLLRKELHDRWGGGPYGGMEPSVKAESVFLFSNPKAGRAFGYKYDGWHADGMLHYTGDGQVGDQLLTTGGNKALMDAEGLGRTIRFCHQRPGRRRPSYPNHTRHPGHSHRSDESCSTPWTPLPHGRSGPTLKITSLLQAASSALRTMRFPGRK